MSPLTPIKLTSILRFLLPSLLVLVLARALDISDRYPPALIAGSPVHLARFTRSNNSLAFELYARARLEPGNVIIAPLAVSNGLVTLWAGARGETAAQIERVFHAEGTRAEAIETAGQIARGLAAPSRRFAFATADRLFVEKSRKVEPAHLERAEHAFGPAVEPADFLGAPEASRRRINDWIAGQTGDHLRDLVPPGAVQPSTSLVIAEAITLRGRWKTRFFTTDMAPFYRTPTDVEEVPQMRLGSSLLPSASIDGVNVIELAYEGGELAMTLMFPAAGTMAQLEARLSPARFGVWIAALRRELIVVKLPRFGIVAHLALGESLKALGMTLAFDRDRADLSAIGRDGLSLDEFFQEVHIEVEAAGAEDEDWRGGPSVAGVFFDVPFLFFVREVRSGLILLMGRVSDPTPPLDICEAMHDRDHDAAPGSTLVEDP